MVHEILKSDVLRLSVISENQTIAESISQLLQCSPFEQTELQFIQSLEEAITQPFESKADILLLDLAVLKEQALEISQSLLQALAELPLLILCDAEHYPQQFISSTVKTVLLKETLSPITLSHTLQQVLEQKQSQQHLQKQVHELSSKVARLECALDNTLLSVHQLYEHTTILESILDAIPDAIVFADSERRVCKVNPAFNHIFEYSSEAVLGNTTEQLYESSSKYHLQEKQRYNLRGNSHISVYEERYRRQGGEVFVGETVGTVVKNRFNCPLGYLGIIRDITDRREMGLALQQSEAVNRALLQAIPDHLLWMRRDGSYLKVKEQSLMSKVALQAAKGNISDCLPPRLAQQQLRYVDKALQTGEIQAYEQQVLWEQQACYEEVRIIPLDADSVLVVVRDITERKRSEVALQTSQERYCRLYEKTPVMLHSIDRTGRLVHVSDHWLVKLGYTSDEVIGRQSSEFLTAESQRYAREVILPEYFKTGICIDVPYQMVTKNGNVIDVLLSATAERDTNGEIVRSLAVLIDVTEHNRTVAALRASETRFHAFMNNSPALAFMKEANTGRFTYINRPFEQYFQLKASDVLGKTDFDWLSAEVATQNRQHDCQVLREGRPLELVESVPDSAGNPQEWLVFKFPCQDANNVDMLGGVAVNITQQKRLEQQLYAEKELAQVTLQSIGDAVITTDAQGIITYLNPIAEELTGWRQEDAQGLALAEVFVILNEYTRELVQCPVNLVLQKGTAASLAKNTILVAKDGRERSIEDSAAPIRDGKGQIVGTVLVFHDVTEARQLANQLTWQVSHDELTQLINRRQFEQELAELLHSPQKGNSVLCYLDLDQFKLVNDTCGHAAGDALLRQIADILVGQVRLTDTVARLGGDEFAILLHQCSLEFARRIANLMCQSIREFRFAYGERSFSVGVSIGLVEITQNNHSLAEVLAAADGACYAAKEAGRNRVHVYRADDLNLSHQRNQQQWCLRIDKALEEDRFQLYHQPIAATDNTQGEYHHTELLLRLLDQEGQTIPPGAFIPAAERYHRMPAIDQWVIQRFLTEMSQVKVNSRMLYNINLSGASLSDERFLRTLEQRLIQSKINPAQICFEVTETAAISNLTRVSAFMSSLKQLGCQFALDDFGSGMSSFGYLRQLPVDYIKIDGSFIQKIEDPINRAIVKSICSVGQAMNIQIIAEWVENKEICSQLKELGVNYVQGYGIAKPRLFSRTKSFN